MDASRAQEVDEAACHGVMMRKQEELLQRLHKTEAALQHATRDYILCESTCRTDNASASGRCSTVLCLSWTAA